MRGAKHTPFVVARAQSKPKIPNGATSLLAEGERGLEQINKPRSDQTVRSDSEAQQIKATTPCVVTDCAKLCRSRVAPRSFKPMG
jgi:hypothetical protein